MAQPNSLPLSAIIKKVLYLALGGALLFLIVFVFGVFQSGDAQGGIGLFFAPFYAIIVAIIGFLLFCAVGIVIQGVRVKIHRNSLRSRDKLYILVSIIFLVFFISVVSFTGITFIERMRARSPHTPSHELYALYERGIKTSNIGILENLAKNPSISPELLYKLYDYASLIDRVHPYSAGSYSILVQIAYNRTTPAPLLEKLSNHVEDSIRCYVAGHPNNSHPSPCIPREGR